MTEVRDDSRFAWLSTGPQSRIGARRVYSSLLEHVGTPFLVARGDGPTGSPATIRLEDSPFVWDLCPGGWSGTDRPLKLRGDRPFRDYLDAISGVRRTRILLESPEGVSSAEVVLTDPWRWGWEGCDVHPLAALVLPNDGTVRYIVQMIRRESPAGGGSTVEAAFHCLRDHRRIDFASPVLERLPSAPPLQQIRPPYRVIFDQAAGNGEGSCIDLVLLIAGCLEAAGQAPILVLLSDTAGPVAHAVLGWWKHGSGGYRPVMELDELRRRVADGQIGLLETTRVCVDQPSGFAEAAGEASARFESAGGAVGVDIRAARPPVGSILPLESLPDSFVLSAIQTSEAAAHDAGSTLCETLHLFLGLLRSGGPIGSRILAEAGLDGREIQEVLEREVRRRSRTDHAGRTRGYQRCLDDARSSARSQGVSVVRESDLWWAVLLGGGSSLSGIESRRPDLRRRLLSALGRISPASRPGSTLA